MKCRKCRLEIPNESNYCLRCGANQSVSHATKSRGNGQGTVFQRANKTWTAMITVGYELSTDGKVKRKTRSKGGFKTKKEAVAYLPKLGTEGERIKSITFQQLYDTWLPTHKAGKSTIDCYKSAMSYYRQIWYLKISDITVDDLQECIDECPKGKRTKENMKTLCGLIYKYGIPRNMIPSGLNMGQYVTVRGGGRGNKEALPNEAVEILEKNIDKVKGADYIVCQCYLGFRPSEFLALDVKDYNRKERAFCGGAKTEAGKNRIVTVSPKIQPIIDKLVKNKVSGPVFCADDGQQLEIKAYRALFYSVLEQCGIENPIEEKDGVKRRKYTPHSCRHTFATMMKRVEGADKDKLELIGHASAEMLRYYQDVCYDDLRRITDSL